MLRSIGSNWVVTVAQIILVFTLTPYVIGVLGDDKYGVWLTVTSLTGFLTLIRGGLPAASVKYIAEAVGSPDPDERVAAINRAVHSALSLYVVLAVICFIVGGALLVGWQTIGRPVPEAWRTEAVVAFVVVVVNVAFGFIAHLPFAVMEAHDDFVPRNAIALSSLVVQGLLTFLLLQFDDSVIFLALTLVVCASFEIVAGVLFVLRRYAGTSFGIAARDRALIGKLFHYSAWVLVLAVGGRLAFNTDAVIISTLDSYDGVAFYNVANSVALYFMEFVAAIAIVVMPRAARLRASGDDEGLRRVFYQWSKASMTLALLVGSFLLFMGPEFLAFWIDDRYRDAGGPALQVLIISFFFFLPMRGAAVPVLMAVGDIKIPAIAYIVMGVANIAISVALIPKLGIVGAAIGTAIPNVLFAAVVFQLACVEVGASRSRYLTYVVIRPLLGAIPVFGWLALCVFVFDARGFFGLLYSGVVTVALFAVMAVAVTYRNDPYVDLLETAPARRIARLLGRGRR